MGAWTTARTVRSFGVNLLSTRWGKARAVAGNVIVPDNLSVVEFGSSGCGGIACKEKCVNSAKLAEGV